MDADPNDTNPLVGAFAAVVASYVAGKAIECAFLWIEKGAYKLFADEEDMFARLAVEDTVDLSSSMALYIVDSNSRQADTFDWIEDDGLYLSPYREGIHKMIWNVTNVRNGEGTYTSDISKIKWHSRPADMVFDEPLAHSLTFRQAAITYTLNNTVDIMVDWEAPASVCIPAYNINLLIDNVYYVLGLGNDGPNVPCVGDEVLVPPLPTTDTEEWISMSILQTDVPENMRRLLAAYVSITDVRDAGGSIPDAIARKLLEETVTYSIVDVDPANPSQNTGLCELLEGPHEAVFQATAGGTSAHDNMARNAADQFAGIVCFEALLLG